MVFQTTSSMFPVIFTKFSRIIESKSDFENFRRINQRNVVRHWKVNKSKVWKIFAIRHESYQNASKSHAPEDSGQVSYVLHLWFEAVA